jgi:hypothetical protein
MTYTHFALALLILQMQECQTQYIVTGDAAPTTETVHPDPQPDGPAFILGNPTYRLFEGEDPPRIEFSPDSSTIYRTDTRRLIAIDTRTGVILFKCQLPHTFYRIYHESDALRIEFRAAKYAGTCLVLDPRTGKQLRSGPNRFHHGRTTTRQFLNGSRAIIETYVRGGRIVSLHNLKTNQELRHGSGREWRLSPDGQLLADAHTVIEIVTTSDGKVRWRITPGEFIHASRLQWTNNAMNLFYVTHNKDGRSVHSFDLSSGIARKVADKIHVDSCRTRGNGYRVMSLPVVSPDGKYFAHLDVQEQLGLTTKRWVIKRTSDGTCEKQLDPLPVPTNGYFSPNSKAFWMASPFGIVKYDIQRGCTDRQSLDSISPITALNFSPDHTRLYGVRNGEIICWSLAEKPEFESRQRICNGFRLKRDRKCNWVSPTGVHTAWIDDPTSAYNRVPHLYAFHGNAAGDTEESFVLPQCGTAVSRGGLQLLKTSKSASAVLVDPRNGSVVSQLPPRNRMFQSLMAMSNDGQYLARVERFPYQRKSGDVIALEVCHIDGDSLGVCKLVVPSGNDSEDRTRAPMIPMQLLDGGTELRVWHRGRFTAFDVPNQRTLIVQNARPPTERNGIAPNGNRFIRISDDTLEVVDMYRQQTCQCFTCPGLSRMHNDVFSFAGDSSLLAVAIPNAPIAVYDIYHKQERTTAKFEHQSSDELWKSLNSDHAQTSFAALCWFIRQGNQSVAFLKTKFRLQPVDPQSVLDLVKQLGHREFAVREAASKRLKSSGALARLQLRKVVKARLSVEQRVRVNDLLTIPEVWPRVGSSVLDRLYAIEILEVINSAASRELLVMLSKTQDGRIGRDASAAVARFSRRQQAG